MGLGYSNPPTDKCWNAIWNVTPLLVSSVAVSDVLAAALAADSLWARQVANADMRDFYIEHVIAPLAAALMVDGTTPHVSIPFTNQH